MWGKVTWGMIEPLKRSPRGKDTPAAVLTGRAVLANAGWLVAALLYGYVVYGLLAPGRYSGGPVLAAICVVAFVVFLLGSARRIRRSAYYEAAAGCLMLGYSLDSLYHRQEVLLSLFLLFAVGVALSGLASS